MELHDRDMKGILSHSKLELPFSDFDNRMLHKIQEYEVKKKAAEKSKFFGHLCFLIGILFGGILTYLMSNDLGALIQSEDTQDKFVSAVQLLYVLLIVLFADKLWKLSRTDFKKLFK
jgi:low temperature requirement protein LtrA